MADQKWAISGESIGARFIQALGDLEQGGDPQRLLELFAPDCSLWNVTMRDPHRGLDEVRRFWASYRGTFSQVRSEFIHREETEGCSVLEWRSTGSLASGQPVEYTGITVLEHDGGRITAFRSYFDTAALPAKKVA